MWDLVEGLVDVVSEHCGERPELVEEEGLLVVGRFFEPGAAFHAQECLGCREAAGPDPAGQVVVAVGPEYGEARSAGEGMVGVAHRPGALVHYVFPVLAAIALQMSGEGGGLVRVGGGSQGEPGFLGLVSVRFFPLGGIGRGYYAVRGGAGRQLVSAPPLALVLGGFHR